jgi:O-antigen ligase
MISTVTTAVSAVTTTALASSLGLLVTLTLLALLIQKEVVSVTQEESWKRLNRSLTIAIVPLALAFLAITLVEMMKVL